MKIRVKALLLATITLVSSESFAATTGPTYSATLNNTRTGNVLTIKGKGFDLYTLLNLSSASAKSSTPDKMNEQVDVYANNGNTRLVFFSTSGTNTITTNSNVNSFAITYTVKITKTSTTARTTNASNPIKIVAVLGDPAKSNFVFVFKGAQLDAAIAGLPVIKKGESLVPVLADKRTGVGVTNFTLQLGSATFVVATPTNGKIIY